MAKLEVVPGFSLGYLVHNFSMEVCSRINILLKVILSKQDECYLKLNAMLSKYEFAKSQL